MANKSVIKATMAAAVLASAVIPAAVAPVAAAEAAPVTEVVYVIDGKEVSISFDVFTEALNAEILSNLDIKFIKAADGNYYEFPAFTEALNASESLEEALELLAADPELVQPITPVEGTVNPDGSVTAPDEETGELKVESVSAINATSVTVIFNKEVEALDKADVTVTNTKTFEKQYVKSVKLADDKKSATVELYDALVNKNTYNVAVKVGEETSSKELEYLVGDVDKIVAETTQVGEANPTVKYKVLDANGLDITSTTQVSFESDKTINQQTGQLALPAGETAFVYVVYTDTDGNKVKSDRITVKAEAPKAVELLNYTISSSAVTKADFEKEDFKPVTSVKMGQGGSIYALVKDQFGGTDVFSNSNVEYESLNKSVALVDRNSGAITPIAVGTADVRIKVGDVSVVRPIEVKAKAEVATLSLDKDVVTISDSVAAGQAVKVTVKDQFGDAVKTSGQNITATVKTGADLLTNASPVTISTDANGVATLTVKPKAGKEGTATVELAIGDVKTTLTVNVTKAGAVDSYVVEGFENELDVNGDVTNSTKLPEKATLEVFAKDANGVTTGNALTTDVTYEVKEGTTVKAGTGITNTGNGKLVLDAAANGSVLEAGKTYTVTAKVGSLEVFKDTFTVKDTSPQPSVEPKKSSVEVKTTSELDFSDLFTVTFSDAVNTTYTVKAIEATSDNASVAKDFVANDPGNDKLISFTSDNDGDATIIMETVTLTISGKDYKVNLNNTPVNVKVSIKKEAAQAALTTYLTTAKGYSSYAQNPAQGNYKALAALAVNNDTNTVTADLATDALAIKTISEKPGIITAADDAGKEITAYAKDLYVMNTLARYLGALEYEATSTVKEIVYNGITYTWDNDKGLKASNWVDANGTTLVSVIAADQNTSIRTVNLTLVDADDHSIDVTFKAVNVPTKEQIESAQQN